MSRSTWLLARAIWVSFLIVFLVFFGLESVFRVLDEAKHSQPHYTWDHMILVSLSGMARRLYLDLPLMVLIAVAAGLGGLAQSSELTILRAAGLRTWVSMSVPLAPPLDCMLYQRCTALMWLYDRTIVVLQDRSPRARCQDPTRREDAAERRRDRLLEAVGWTPRSSKAVRAPWVSLKFLLPQEQ